MHQLSTLSDRPRALLAAISAPLVAGLLQYLASTCTERLVETTVRELGDIFVQQFDPDSQQECWRSLLIPSKTSFLQLLGLGDWPVGAFGEAPS